MNIPDELRNIRDHLRSGRFGQREEWERQLEMAANEIEQRFFYVAQLQPDIDTPGLWIGFKTADQRAAAMKMFRECK